jgi:hypothetical protein
MCIDEVIVLIFLVYIIGINQSEIDVFLHLFDSCFSCITLASTYYAAASAIYSPVINLLTLSLMYPLMISLLLIHCMLLLHIFGKFVVLSLP